jgi:hypothetical protein
MNVRDDLNGTEVSLQGGNNGRQVEDFMYGKKFTDGKPGDGVFFGFHNEAQSYAIQQDTLRTSFAQNSSPENVQWKENGEYPSETMLAKIQSGPFKAIVYQDHADEIAPTDWFGGNANLQSTVEQFQGNLNDQMEVLAYRMEYHIASTDEFSFYLYSDDYKKQWWIESLVLDTQRKRTAGINGDAKLMDNKLDITFGGDLWGEDQITAPSYTSAYAATLGVSGWYASPTEIQKTPFSNFFVQGNYAVSNTFKVLLGGRADYQQDAQPTNTIYTGPRIGLMYSPTDKVTFKYLYNGTSRRPQANELNASGVAQPSAETLAAHELIAIADISDKLKLDVTLFSQKLQNEIERVNGVGLNVFTNTGGLSTNGVEWALKYFPTKDTLVYWNGSYDASQVNQADINGIIVADAQNGDHDPLFVPLVTSFIGAEVPVAGLKANAALRSILDIPYQAIDGSYATASAEFVDVTIRTKKFWKNTVDLSLVGLNVLNNQQPLPAYGEHAGNAAGTLQPEGVSVYLKATFDF